MDSAKLPIVRRSYLDLSVPPRFTFDFCLHHPRSPTSHRLPLSAIDPQQAQPGARVSPRGGAEGVEVRGRRDKGCLEHCLNGTQETEGGRLVVPSNPIASAGRIIEVKLIHLHQQRFSRFVLKVPPSSPFDTDRRICLRVSFRRLHIYVHRWLKTQRGRSDFSPPLLIIQVISTSPPTSVSNSPANQKVESRKIKIH